MEDAFWLEFRRIADARGQSVNDLAAEIDAARGVEAGLASSIRVFVLETLQAQAAERHQR